VKDAIQDSGSVLVVDDDHPCGKVTAMALRGAHRVDVAHSAAEALDALRAGKRYDVILTDVAMPQMNGLQLFEIIRAERLAPAEDVVFMTGGIAGELALQIQALPNEVLFKPVPVGMLRAVILARVQEATARRHVLQMRLGMVPA
jgi:CheY-like chemotaxis protein